MLETLGSEAEPIISRQYPKWRILLLWGIVVLTVVLRVAALASDAYPRLSWSSALLTDEGFYLHNARNLVLYDNASQDEWNNALIMPTLHAVQVGVFRNFGVGIVQARSISVVFSFALLLLLFVTIKRAYNVTTAWFGVLFLGLDHSFLLYNRLALLDTPAAALLVGALACFVYGLKSERKAFACGLACGLVFVLGYTVRGFAALLFVCPFFALLPSRKENKRQMIGIAAGLIAGMVCYFVLWYLPNQAELSRYNHYYLQTQLMPHSLRQLANNIRVSLFHWARGMVPYLIKHTPLLFGLAAVRCVAFFRDKARRNDPIERFLIVWLLSLMLVCSVVNYAPSRYYVLFYPAMMILAARQVSRSTSGIENTRQQKASVFQTRQFLAGKIFALPVLMTIWVLLNGYWLTDWLAHLQYKQLETDQFLARTLPAESWLIGPVSAGVCINNRLHPVNMIVGLCNDKQPVEKHVGMPRYIVILDGNWREAYFAEHYSSIITEKNKVASFQGLLRPFFEIGVYQVPKDFGAR